MIVDSSAVVAILLREPEHEHLIEQLSPAENPGIGTPTLAETGIVLAARLGESGRSLLARFLQESGLVEVTFGEHHWRTAVDAYVRFGKGRHPAALNFGDCMTYAIAQLAGEPLLCVGEDFARTDITLVGGA